MIWELDKGRALCPQICEQICVGIARGEFGPDTKLMSVREIAVAAGVNPNTVQRAFETLERDNVLYSVRGSGWFVCEDTTRAKDVLESIVQEKIRQYFEQMNALGFDTEQSKNYIKEWKE